MEIPFGIIVGLIVFLLGLAVGLPICWVFLVTVVTASFLTDSPLLWIAGTAYHAVNNYIIMAIAFFIFAGNLMSQAGLAERFARLAYALVGRIKGGMADVGVVSTLFLGALTGSSLPCVATMVPLLVPQLERYGYERRYTTAILCSSSFLGYLIPPSVPVLMYCLIAQQSVAAVFVSTIFPGLLLAGGYMVVNYFISDKYVHASKEIPELPTTFKESLKEVGTATWYALPALGCPLVVLGGIYGGACTPNEAGALAVVYTLIIGFFVYRGLKVKNFLETCRTTVVILGMITLLLLFGIVLARLLIRQKVAQSVAAFVMGAFESKYLILFSLNILILFLGMFIDGIPILLVAVPLLMPLVTQIDVNLVHLGAIIVVNVGIGMITPPYAETLFLGSRLSGVPFEQLVAPMLRFLFFVALPVLFLTTYIPAFSCWLPTLLVGPKIVGAW